MATSVSLAISRELTGFGLEPSHHRKGAGWEPSPGGPWTGATAPSPPGETHFGGPPPRPRAPHPSIARFDGATVLVQWPLPSNANMPGVVAHTSPQDEAEAGFRAVAVS